jgi:hypothetical protein
VSKAGKRNIPNHRRYARLTEGLPGSLNNGVYSTDLSAKRLIQVLFALAAGKKRLDIQQDDNSVPF